MIPVHSIRPRFAPRLSAVGVAIGIVLSVTAAREELSADPVENMARRREPIRIVQTSEGLFVANHFSGSVSLVEPTTGVVLGEYSLGRRLTDLVAFDSPESLVAADEGTSQLILFRLEAGRPAVLHRQSVPQFPIQLLPLISDSGLLVASLWARQLTQWSLVDGDGTSALSPVDQLDLPFAPRLMCALPDRRHVVVADAFGSQLAVVVISPLRLESVFRIPGHNIRGLSLNQDGTQLIVSHQLLNDFIPTTRDHVFWGNVVSNLVRWIDLHQLLNKAGRDSGTEPRSIHGKLLPLGHEGRGAGDPEQVVQMSHGDLLIVLAGTDELAVYRNDSTRLDRLTVGRRPSSLLVDRNGQSVWVTSRFDDTVCRVDLERFRVDRTIPLGSMPQADPVQRGREAFYDASLSLDGWFSCHSCHTDGHTCGLLNDNFGDNSLGAPKRIPSLLGTGRTGPWAWNGQQPTLRQQVEKSMITTLRAEPPERTDDRTIQTLVTFLNSLEPPPSVAAARGHLDTPAVSRGTAIFQRLECDSCHVPPEFTSPETYDVGLTDELGNVEFNPPSLRGLSHRARLFHDNRARSLRDLLEEHPGPDAPELDPAEWSDLQAFLLSL